MSSHRAAFLARVPDDAGHLDLRGLLLSGRCSLYGDPADGFVVRSWDLPYAVAHGAPPAEVVRQATAAPVDGDAAWHLMAEAAHAAGLAAALPGWRRREVILHLREPTAPSPPEPPGCDLRLAPEGWRAAGLHLGDLPPALRREMEADHVAERPLAAALVEGRVASFCYAPIESETLWDVSVDTLAPHRGRGLAGACFERLARYQASRDRMPVWGAVEENAASLALAARLGFREAARLASFVRP